MPATNPEPNTQAAASPELGLTMTQILRNPLAALRAQMESMAGEFQADDPRSTQLRDALEHVLRMSRDVEALVQLTAPRPLAPLDCTVDELLHSSLRGLRFEYSSRVKLANSTQGRVVHVDGPLLSGCLGRLVENALSNPDEWVLLSARLDGEHVGFSIVEGNEDGAKSQAEGGLTPQRQAALQLGLLLVRRDLERMGCSMSVTHTLLGNTCVTVRVPLRAELAPEAEAA